MQSSGQMSVDTVDLLLNSQHYLKKLIKRRKLILESVDQ